MLSSGPNQWCSFKDRPPNGGGGVGDGWDVKKDGGEKGTEERVAGGFAVGKGGCSGRGGSPVGEGALRSSEVAAVAVGSKVVAVAVLRVVVGGAIELGFERRGV